MTPEQEKNIINLCVELQKCIGNMNNSLSLLIFSLQRLSSPDFDLDHPSNANIVKTLLPHLFNNEIINFVSMSENPFKPPSITKTFIEKKTL